MREFMLLIRTQGDCSETMTPEQHETHLEKVIAYIQSLKDRGRLIAAQPLGMNGSIIAGKSTSFKDGPFVETKEIIAGYFIVRARDLAEAKEIAKAHPLFVDSDAARIEIREIKMEAGINS